MIKLGITKDVWKKCDDTASWQVTTMSLLLELAGKDKFIT